MKNITFQQFHNNKGGARTFARATVLVMQEKNKLPSKINNRDVSHNTSILHKIVQFTYEKTIVNKGVSHSTSTLNRKKTYIGEDIISTTYNVIKII